MVRRDRRLSVSLHIPAVHGVAVAELCGVASQVLQILEVPGILRPSRLQQVPALLFDGFGHPAHLHDRAHFVARTVRPGGGPLAVLASRPTRTQRASSFRARSILTIPLHMTRGA